MRTETKIQIVDIIKKNGPSRPSALVQALHISQQALHRHLNDLIAGEILERRGNPPFTTYVLAGASDFNGALAWYQSKKAPASTQEICETRDVFSARLSRLMALEKQGLTLQELSLVIAMTGEIGNNSFDHNLGQWRDVPGCWFESQQTKRRMWILIADRGQGIFQSLLRVDQNIPNEQNAIEKAFHETISGRAPEQRGNGLKFVKKVVTEHAKCGLACLSGSGRIHFGQLGMDCTRVLHPIPSKNTGTITLIVWMLHEDKT
jgi:hypothetical protein